LTLAEASSYWVPFDGGKLTFTLPGGMRALTLDPQPVAPLVDVEAAIAEALAKPVGSPPLAELAGPSDRVCVVFTDATRAVPDHLLVPALLRELEAAGVRDEDITLLCGVGFHRPSTPLEKIQKLGGETATRYRVADHAASDPAQLADLGTWDGIPLLVNRLAVDADLLIATGVVEPHQYAGYSGGRKTTAIGAGGEATITVTHGPAMLDHPGTRLGSIEGNRFHQAVTESARRAGLRFILNVVQDGAHRVVAVRAGEPAEAFAELVEIARGVYEVSVSRQYAIVVAGVDPPKDANLYQASRAATYLWCASRSVVRPGGVIILPARCPEGAGQGSGERRFFELLRDADGALSLVSRLRKEGYPPGGQRAYVVAQMLTGCQVIVVGTEDPAIVRECHMTPAATIEEALSMAQDRVGREAEALIVPHALLTLPGVQEE
jgi:nickel-dependent lactate racemase